MIHIAVVDDDYRVIADITRMLKAFYGEDRYEQDDFCDGYEFIQNIGKPIIYDIVFMDIEMKRMNGEDAIRKLRESDINENTYVVYISSHTDNLSSLFALHPFDFLVKPVSYDKLSEVLKKMSIAMVNKRASISVTVNRKEMDICLSEIRYIQSEAHKLKIFMRESGVVLYCYMKMDDIYKKIQEKSSDFVRIHASFIVNRCYVSRYQKASLLIGNTEIPISQKFRNEMMINIHRGV